MLNTKTARRSRPWGTVLVASVIVASAAFFSWEIEKEASQRRHQQERMATSEQLNAIGARIQGTVLHDIALTTGLAVEIAINPDSTSDEFSRYASALLGNSDTAIVHTAVSQDLRITKVYPLAGNEEILGIDYRDYPAQLKIIKAAMKYRAPFVSGPYDLIQGGTAFIIRMPILDEHEGGNSFISSVMDYQSLLDRTGLSDQNHPLAVTISAINPDEKEGRRFFGDAQIIDQAPVYMTLQFPIGSWELAALPKNGWTETSPRFANILPLPLLTLIAAIAVCYFKIRRDKESAKATRILQQSAKRFRSLFENASDGIFIIEQDGGHILNANEKAAQLLGVSPEALKNRLFKSQFATQSGKSIAANKNGTTDLSDDATLPGLFQTRLIRDDGKTIPVEISTAKIEDGDTPFIIAHMRDITIRSRYEAELDSARLAAERANDLKSRFLANFSHEIRTPLNAIVGFSEIMRKSMFGEIKPTRYAEYVEDIHHSGKHLLEIINDILDLSRIEAGEMPLAMEWIDLSSFLEDCKRITVQLAKEKTISFTCIPPTAPVMIYADPGRLRQILINLIGNAIKFTLPGGSVEVSGIVMENGGVDLTVRDTGIGMSEKHLKDALRPFGQIASKKSVDQSGTGLGLTLSRALCQLQDIQFSIESEQDEGTIVRLCVMPDQTKLTAMSHAISNLATI
ncbi:hypothetical protein JCM17845_26640 [Iodidimonas gelatinilytica]|uniref:histidine kinase n=2 Tax=Iodidimonas gelatinilytica TaxID=1236966 RepID=A0A5A7N188_9PROT|nr:histidine kinase dimerization/phospho-acceptor domain-containing protein [Iodidimonas gelatinilytica]GER02041.1 hypothetical protein JCM17845_26640 [Iodidimonas gelatinilytica]